jgi:uncharacterized membrane protein YhaH (DUF805 family)
MNFNLDWKYLFTSFDGRINRQPFWTGIIVLFVANIVLAIIGGILGAILPILSTLVSIVSLVLIYPALALYAKRWHDRSKSGWWTLIMLIPLLGLIYAIYEIGIQEGVPEANQYGPNPLGRAIAA